MALIIANFENALKLDLESKIKPILNKVKNVDDTAVTADQKATELSVAIAKAVSSAVDTYIRSATITVPIATPITTTAGPGTLLAPINCIIL